MGESRKRNSVKLSEAGKQRFIEAKAVKRNYEGNLATDLEIATEAGVSEKTVERFFSGKPVDKKTAIAIANALEVNDLEKWLEPKEPNSPENTPETPIDWHHVCHEMLKAQQEKQKFRQQITGRGLGHEVNVYVPLGLVKPKEQPRRGEDFQPSADRGMQQYILVCGGIKGGVGKSTLATNLTVIRAAQGFDVLLVDADEQRTSSDFTLIRNEALADKGGAG
jgi:chromosome partitioning protein